VTWCKKEAEQCRARIFKTHEAKRSIDAGRGALICSRKAALDGYCWQHHPNYRPTYATPKLDGWPPEELLP
jgi:hypothetical protein